MAADAQKAGNAEKATQYNSAAESIASQLIQVEKDVESLKSMVLSSTEAADQAKAAVQQNSRLLQEKIAEKSKLLSQLEQAKMQETVAASLESMSALAVPGNTPSLEEVREKIERRYATAMGRAELASTSIEGRMLEVQKSTLDMAGASRLEQIRASMAGEQLPAAPAKPELDQAATDRAAGVARLDEIRASMAEKSKSEADTA